MGPTGSRIAMPQFLDAFIEQISKKRDSLAQKMAVGRASGLDADLERLLLEGWRPLPAHGGPDREVAAVDGSRAIRALTSGAIFYITRAIAVLGRRRFRELEADAFFSKAKPHEISVFIGRKMEWLELKAAIRAIREGDLSDGAPVLMDGSLYGRLLHLPRDQPAEGMRGFMLDYFKTLWELFELCRERRILLIGVSKESRSSFLRDHLLGRLLEWELGRLDGLPEEVKVELRAIFETALQAPSEAFSALRKLKMAHGGRLEGVERIIREAASARPDHQLIRRFAKAPGYTAPLELGASKPGSIIMELIGRDPRAYAKRYFKEAILEAEDEGAFIREAIGILARMPELPSIVSFHLLPDPRDTPMRVDIPSWACGLSHRISDFAEIRPAEADVGGIAALLMGGYAGLKDYNVWLKRADEEVRLSRDIVDGLYSSALERMLNVTIIHPRGYRRVKYP
ncbi:MAG: DNA double-strand break repair nuclease NurA [Candidatus Bathyarchaeia archaeon]